MKRVILIALATSLFSAVFSIIIGLLTPFERQAEEAVEVAPEISVIYTSSDAGVTEDGTVEVSIFIDGKTERTDLHSYIVGVLAAEMPASFELEALKAQAVAARTFTLYKITKGRPASHPNADVCNYITCCQAYCDKNEMQAKWGLNFETNLSRIELAVKATDGICAVYSGEPIFAAFHSSSCGKTEAYSAVWEMRICLIL